MSLAKALQNRTLRRMGNVVAEQIGRREYKVWKDGTLLGRVRNEGRLTWLIFDECDKQLGVHASTLKSAVAELNP